MTAVLDRPKEKIQEVQRLTLPSVSWQTYDMLLHAFEGRHLRITFDRGSLEIMTLSNEHESYGEFLGHLVLILALELSIPIRSGGSTTFRSKAIEKGLEPDKCWWIENIRLMRGKKNFNIESDPPPDLAVEIDISRSSLNRLAVYAALGVREVWRFDGATLYVYHLLANGQFKERKSSQAFSFLPMEEVQRFLIEYDAGRETEQLQSFQQWVRETLAPDHGVAKSKAEKKNGKRSSK